MSIKSYISRAFRWISIYPVFNNVYYVRIFSPLVQLLIQLTHKSRNIYIVYYCIYVRFTEYTSNIWKYETKNNIYYADFEIDRDQPLYANKFYQFRLHMSQSQHYHYSSCIKIILLGIMMPQCHIVYSIHNMSIYGRSFQLENFLILQFEEIIFLTVKFLYIVYCKKIQYLINSIFLIIFFFFYPI